MLARLPGKDVQIAAALYKIQQGFQQEKSFRIGYGFGDVAYFREGLEKLGEYLDELARSQRAVLNA